MQLIKNLMVISLYTALSLGMTLIVFPVQRNIKVIIFFLILLNFLFTLDNWMEISDLGEILAVKLYLKQLTEDKKE